MAKSIRSKRMRKLRAFKRIRYGEKELARLKNMLEKAAEEEKQNSAAASQSDSTENSCAGASTSVMEVDKENVESLVTKPSKYPCWLSHFKIKKLAKIERKCKRKEAKRLKKEEKKELKKGKKKGKGKKKL